MAEYEVYVLCGQCGRPHSLRVKVNLDGEQRETIPLTEIFTAADLPASIAFMQTNKYNCPHTKQLYTANDAEQTTLVRVATA